MSQGLGIDVELPLPVDEAARMVRDALKQEGFGVLTEIDLQAAFRKKLGCEFRPYLILGACNPPLAFAAINADPGIGLLLTCNVTVESVGERRTIVRLTNPEACSATWPSRVRTTSKARETPAAALRPFRAKEVRGRSAPTQAVSAEPF